MDTDTDKRSDVRPKQCQAALLLLANLSSSATDPLTYTDTDTDRVLAVRRHVCFMEVWNCSGTSWMSGREKTQMFGCSSWTGQGVYYSCVLMTHVCVCVWVCLSKPVSLVCVCVCECVITQTFVLDKVTFVCVSFWSTAVSLLSWEFVQTLSSSITV